MDIKGFDGLRPHTAAICNDHHQWRKTLRNFVDTHIAPNIEVWTKTGRFPDDLFVEAAKENLFGMGFSNDLGGWEKDADLYHRIIFAEELHRLGSGVVYADLATHWVALPPVVQAGDPKLLDTVVRPILAGRQKIAFAVTEPSGGSDVSAFKTMATPDGDDYILSGEKTLISGALIADWLLIVAKVPVDQVGKLTLFLVNTATSGVSISPVSGLSWYSNSNGLIELNNVRIPKIMRVSEIGGAFLGLTRQFNIERLSAVAAALALARVATADAIAWAQKREAFGNRIIDHQSIRHCLVSMVADIRCTYSYLDQCVARFNTGKVPVADLCMLKVQASGVLKRCAQGAMSVLGGQAYQDNWRVQRIHREAQIFMLGGGTKEVLFDLAARQMKF